MLNIVQGSPEWFAIRFGKVTASKMADMTAKTKSGYSSSRGNYMAQIIVERLTGKPAETYSNAAMQWGTDTEPKARAVYSFMRDVDVVEVGFIPHPSIADSGASPDGLIGDDGMIEIKCPNTATHIETLLGEPVEGKYIKQMQWQMACANRKWCDFVSFDPRLPADLQLKIVRVNRDDVMIAELEKETTAFLFEVAEKMAKLEGLRV